MVIDMNYWTRVLKRIVLLILSLIIIFFSFKLAVFYIPFLIGFIISCLIEPMIRFISNKTKLTRKLSAVIVLLIIFSILIGLIIVGILTLISESSGLLQSLNSYIELIYKKVEDIVNYIDFKNVKIPEEVLGIIENSTNSFLQTITKYVSASLTSIIQGFTKIPILSIYIVITILSTYFICTDKFFILDQLEHHLPRQWVKKMNVKTKKIMFSLGSYLKAELILVGITFLIVLTGLYIFKFLNFNLEYPFLIALGIGFIDALPILRVWKCNCTLGSYFWAKWRY